MSGIVNATNTGGVVTRRVLPGLAGADGERWWLPPSVWELVPVGGGAWRTRGVGRLTGGEALLWEGVPPVGGMQLFLREEALPIAAAIATDDGVRYGLRGFEPAVCDFVVRGLEESNAAEVAWVEAARGGIPASPLLANGTVAAVSGELRTARRSTLVAALAPGGAEGTGPLAPVRLVRILSGSVEQEVSLPGPGFSGSTTVLKWITLRNARRVIEF
jgi:hypothetical protein